MHKSTERVRAVTVVKVVPECMDVTSLWFKDEQAAAGKPGQYVMAWMPGVDEVPMSLSAIGRNGLNRISIRNIGIASDGLSGITEGERIGLRGPFGTSYVEQGESPLFVAGGVGMASLMPLLESMVTEGRKPTVVLGARTGSQLLYVDELSEMLGENLIVSTDDGTRGYSGYASGYAAKLMESGRYDQVYTCGPELMMAKVFYAAEDQGLPVQASLERFIKCAVGVCGSCAIGRYRVCVDGPVFDSEVLRAVREEFGVARMDASGTSFRVDH